MKILKLLRIPFILCVIFFFIHSCSFAKIIYYRVRRGDTLSEIASRFGISEKELKRINHLRSSRIYVGQRLKIIVRKSSAEKKSQHKKKLRYRLSAKHKKIPKSKIIYVYHVVKKGETLSLIAQRYGMSLNEIKRINHLKTRKIYVGQRLKVKIKKRKILKKKYPKKRLKRAQQKRLKIIYYRVRRGDTLSEIASRFGISEKELKRINHLRSSRIYVGQRLKIIVRKSSAEKKSQYKKKLRYRLSAKHKKIPKSKIKSVEFLNSSEIGRYFEKLDGEYNKLLLCSSVSRRDWLNLIEKYRRIYLLYPGSKVAPKAILRTADIYYRLYQRSLKKKDLKEAIDKYELLINNFPSASETETAYFKLIQIYERDLRNYKKARRLKKIFAKIYPKSPYLLRLGMVRNVKLKKVLDIQSITGEDYTRVIISISGNFYYTTDILKGCKNKPPRIYIDIYPARVSKKLPKRIDIKKSHLIRIRVGQFDRNTVRVVLDLKSLTSYKIFKLKDPYKLILDLVGKENQGKRYINLARQLGLGIRRIVIDPGHGGKDSGAIGPTGLEEKNVTLKIAKILKKILEKELHVKVILTRDKDIFVPLMKRTAIANSKRADLFISIHVNASPDPEAKGIETYYLNFTTDPEAMRVAALENAISNKRLSDLQDLVKAILANTKLSESKLLAEKIQHQLVSTLSRYYPDTTDRGVKYAPFLVLVGTRMPAVLVEVDFITNPTEEARLKNPHYLHLIAEGIAKGIESYIQSLHFFKPNVYEKRY